jgi:DNA-binding transcriptional LysR family regulator
MRASSSSPTLYLQEFVKLQETAKAINDLPNGKITFGSSILSSRHVMEGITIFLSKFKDVKFNFVETYDPDLVRMVLDGQVDIALVSLPRDVPEAAMLRMTQIKNERICLLLSNKHPLSGHTSVTFKDISDERLIFSSTHSYLYKVVQKNFEEQNIIPNTIMFLNNAEARIPLLRNGAVTFIAHEFQFYNQEDLVVVPVKPHIFMIFYLITSADRKPSLLTMDLHEILYQELIKRLGPSSGSCGECAR